MDSNSNGNRYSNPQISQISQMDSNSNGNRYSNPQISQISQMGLRAIRVEVFVV